MSTQNKSSEMPLDAKPRRGWGRVVLIVSLALNLLFVGAIVGAGWMRHKFHGHRGGPPDFVIKRMLGDLPREKQDRIFALLKNHRQVRGEKIKAIRKEIKALHQVLQAEHLDSGKIRLSGQNLHDIRGELVNARTELLIQVLQKLTLRERQKLLESRLFRRLFRPKGRRHSWRSRHHSE